MLGGCIGGFVPVDGIPKWKTDFSVAEEGAGASSALTAGGAAASTVGLGGVFQVLRGRRRHRELLCFSSGWASGWRTLD